MRPECATLGVASSAWYTSLTHYQDLPLIWRSWLTAGWAKQCSSTREVSIIRENPGDEDLLTNTMFLFILLLCPWSMCMSLTINHFCILGTLVDRTPSKPLSPCYPGRRISRGEYLESAWQEGDPQHLLKGFDLGGIEDPIAHSSLTVVQEHGHMSQVYWCEINLQIGMQSGTMCTQEPAVPTKLHQDVTKLGVILVPIIVSV